MKIRIFQIKVNPGRREADPEAVHKLADSISEVGLMNPITVDQEYTLIAGLHRLEAVKMLGWAEIECTVSSLDGLLAQLAEIDENLIRRGLDYVDEGEQLARRKEIYEMLHPETRQGQRNGQTSKTATIAVLDVKPFAEDAAEKLGMAPRTIRAKIQVAKNLTPQAKEIVKGSDIGINSALKISRLPPEQQEDAARQMASKSSHSTDNSQPAAEEPEQSREEHTPPPEAPTAALVSDSDYYATTKDSVDDLKNPDKDRSRTPDTFYASFSFFLERFCQGITNYSSPEYTAVFPALTQEQLDQIQQQVNSSCTALRSLFHKMERMAQE